MRDTFGATFKTYYDGDPEAIPLFNLPAAIVSQPSDTTVEGQINQDDVSDTIVIKLVLNKQDDFSLDLNPLNTTERRLRDYVGKRDTATGGYDSKTVKYALRTMSLDDLIAIGGDIQVEYGINPRPAPGDDFASLTAEAHVTFTARSIVDH